MRQLTLRQAMSRALALLSVLLLGLCAPPRPAMAAERQLELRLVYRVAPGCPAADVFLARLNEHVGYGGNNYLEGSVVVVPAGERGFRLFVQFNGGRLDELEGQSCDALVDEAVRTAGLARTDSPVQKAEAQLQRALELGAQREGWAPAHTAPAHTAPAHTAEPAPLRAQPAVDPAIVDLAVPADRAARGALWRPSVLAQAHYVSGALPRPALGAGLLLAAEYRGLQGRLELALWPAQPFAFLTGPRAAEVDLQTGSAALGLCSRLIAAALAAGELQLAGCVRGAFVRLTSLSSPDYAAGATQYGTLGSRLGLSWVYSGLQLELMGGLDVARGERTLGPASGNNRFTPESAQLAASLALGWQFGGTRAE